MGDSEEEEEKAGLQTEEDKEVEKILKNGKETEEDYKRYVKHVIQSTDYLYT